MKVMLLINFFELIDEWSEANIGMSVEFLVSLLAAAAVIIIILVIIKKMNRDPDNPDYVFNYTSRSIGGKQGKEFLVAKRTFVAIIRNEQLIDEFFKSLDYKRHYNIFPYKIILIIRNDDLALKLNKELRKRRFLNTRWIDILRKNKIIVDASNDYDFEANEPKPIKDEFRQKKLEVKNAKKKNSTTIIPLYPNHGKPVMQQPSPAGKKSAAANKHTG